jgi:hypothetical protein
MTALERASVHESLLSTLRAGAHVSRADTHTHVSGLTRHPLPHAYAPERAVAGAYVSRADALASGLYVCVRILVCVSSY